MKLAVIGDPVAHSLSPAFFREYFAGAAVAGTYEAIRVGAGECAREVARLRDGGYRGLNVTTPLKEEALAACDRVNDPEATASGSANVLLFQTDGIHGFNTDTTGALAAVAEALERDDVAGVRILVLGVGPTARAAIWKLGQAGATVAIWNRAPERARQTAQRYQANMWNGEEVDLVFSTLPPDATLPDDVVRAASGARCVIDANYGPRATLAGRLGRAVIDGTTMLRSSALESFRLFSMPRSEMFASGVAATREVWG